MAIAAISQVIVTKEQVRTHLQENSISEAMTDTLQLHINGATSFLLGYTGRKRLVEDSGSDLTEYYDGDGTQSLILRESPVISISEVVLDPHYSSVAVTLTGPTAPALQTDDMYIDAEGGILYLKNYSFPNSSQSVQLDYSPGFEDTADEFLALQAIVLDTILRRFTAWKEKRSGVSSTSRSEESITYTADDFDKEILMYLERFRRTLIA